ncbi:YjbH domain-containing protein [Rhodobacteraceae bacterium NNCM2]|nr:YjbH domain-containing protein [Coraliihabitans acroporae]
MGDSLRGQGKLSAKRSGRTASTACQAAAVALLFALSLPGSANAEEPEAEIKPRRPSYNNYGLTGLIEMPTAEVQPDAQVSFTSSFHNGFSRNTLAATILPGLEVAFRYSALQDMAGPNFNETLYDRSMDIKFQLVEESKNWPAVAVALQDFLGTGIYSGEYIVATKSFLDGDLKATGGVGWGRLASVGAAYNPFRAISSEFDTRDSGGDLGGTVNFGDYFSGPQVGFFGGLEWQTPIEGLSVKAEYASDDYISEQQAGAMDVNFNANFGIEYRPLDGLEVGAYYMYGSNFGVRVTLTGNPFDPLSPNENEPAPLPLVPREMSEVASLDLGPVENMVTGRVPTVAFDETGVTDVVIEERIGGIRWAEATVPASSDYICPADAATAIDAEYGVIDVVTFLHPEGRTLCTVALRPEGQQAIRLTRAAAQDHPVDWYQNDALRQQIVEALVAELDADDLGLFGIEIFPTKVSVYIENDHFRSTPRAIGRTARALTRTMPPSIEDFEIVPVEDSLPVVQVNLNRSELEDQVNRPDAARRAWLTANVEDAKPFSSFNDPAIVESFPRFTWSINPAVPVSLFDPDQPIRADLAVEAAAGIEVLPGLSANGRISKQIVGNLDDIPVVNDSQLPHVRSDYPLYLKDGDPAITRLTGDYLVKLDDSLYGRVSVGLIERMFGGVSTEILWKPADQSWGLGAEIDYVKQRDFDTLFTFQDYDVITAHASIYWETGLYGIFAQLDGGRYLAGDYGGTITLKRRFSNGWEIGGFATFTDVPFDEFGEGSFDKGIFLTIPFNWVLPYESKSEFSTVLRPLTRDGGQRLDVSNRLYPIVQDYDRGALRTTWDNFWE